MAGAATRGFTRLADLPAFVMVPVDAVGRVVVGEVGDQLFLTFDHEMHRRSTHAAPAQYFPTRAGGDRCLPGEPFHPGHPVPEDARASSPARLNFGNHSAMRRSVVPISPTLSLTR